MLIAHWSGAEGLFVGEGWGGVGAGDWLGDGKPRAIPRPPSGILSPFTLDCIRIDESVRSRRSTQHETASRRVAWRGATRRGRDDRGAAAWNLIRLTAARGGAGLAASGRIGSSEEASRQGDSSRAKEARAGQGRGQRPPRASYCQEVGIGRGYPLCLCSYQAFTLCEREEKNICYVVRVQRL